MTAEYQLVHDAILFAKADVIMDTISRLTPIQFALSVLLALRQTRDNQATCPDGCGLYFSKCPRWVDNPEELNRIKHILENYTTSTTPSMCGTCLLPNRPANEIHAESSIAVDHKHPNADDERAADHQTKLDIFGPGLLLLTKKPIQSVMAIGESIDLTTPDQVIEFLRFDDPLPRIQKLFLLCYHLFPTTSHSPDTPARSVNAAANNQELSLPTRMANNIHLHRLASSAVEAAVASVNEMESLKPISGSMVQEEHYADETMAKVTVYWNRTNPKEKADERAMFAARCQTVIGYLNKLTEYDARIMFRILVQEQAGNLWDCPCGSDTYFRSCTHCSNTNEDRKGTIKWINGILSTLTSHFIKGDDHTASQCYACLLPILPRDCPPDYKSILKHDRQLQDDRCVNELSLIFAPAIALLYRTSVRNVMDFPDDCLKDSSQVSEWLATPWPTIPHLSMIHRLYFLHYFLLPTTRHSPLTGGFSVIRASNKRKASITLYRGPSEANITYMREIENGIMYAAIESVRPTVHGSRTVEKSTLDGTVQSQVTNLDV